MQVTDHTVSVEEYLRLDAVSEVRLEYHAGRIFAMSGSDWNHNRIAHRISILLQKGDCRSVIGDQRVHVDSTFHAYTYPDVVVVCGEPLFTEGNGGRTLLNPTLIVEVLSPSTSNHDWGWKQRSYVQIPSLREYWVVDPDPPALTRYSRRGDLWKIETLNDLQAEIEGYPFRLSALFED